MRTPDTNTGYTAVNEHKKRAGMGGAREKRLAPGTEPRLSLPILYSSVLLAKPSRDSSHEKPLSGRVEQETFARIANTIMLELLNIWQTTRKHKTSNILFRPLRCWLEKIYSVGRYLFSK